MHLQIAERLRAHRSLNGSVRSLLEKEWSAFYLGSVAPDFQVIADIPREDTHFYHMPPDPEAEAHQVMWTAYPELSTTAVMPDDQAVFVAAYSAHLMLDLRWYREVLVPHFIQPTHWDDHRHRFTIHNILLTYLDKLAWETLPETAAGTLAASMPQHWLPFAPDAELVRWRDLLVNQLRPGATIQTVEIYAGRLNMSPAEFAANLDNPAWMEKQLFSRVPVADVKEILNTAVAQSVQLITDYLTR